MAAETVSIDDLLLVPGLGIDEVEYFGQKIARHVEDGLFP